LARGRSPLRKRRSSEAGFSLPEILVIIFIVGVAFAAILGGMITSITVSALHRKEATADTFVRDAAERLKDRGQAYQPCAGTGSYALPPVPSGYSVSVSVKYWDGTSFNPVTFVPSCPSPDKGMQLITVAASSGQVHETVTIVKRTG
jgi:type II secretory pathway pseudopilin PulG